MKSSVSQHLSSVFWRRRFWLSTIKKNNSLLNGSSIFFLSQYFSHSSLMKPQLGCGGWGKNALQELTFTTSRHDRIFRWAESKLSSNGEKTRSATMSCFQGKGPPDCDTQLLAGIFLVPRLFTKARCDLPHLFFHANWLIMRQRWWRGVKNARKASHTNALLFFQ